MANLEKANRLDWVDNIKGFGIIAVVIGHLTVFQNSFIFLFHMPLFFFISGYLFKFKEPKTFLFNKVNHLLLPYFTYLLFILPWQSIFYEESLVKGALRYFMGGRYLYAWTGVFWFTTCLFLTQQLFNLFQFIPKNYGALINILLFILAYLNSYFFNYNFLWNVNVCLYAIPIFYTGFLFKKVFPKDITFLTLLFSVVFLIICNIVTYTYPEITINMKRAVYGIPILSFILSLVVIICLIIILKRYSFFRFFRSFGQASMVIMYLHFPFYFVLKDVLKVTSFYILFSVSLFLPLSLYYLFKKNTFSRKFLLGE